MATIDFTFDPNQLGGAGAPVAGVLTTPGDPAAGQTYQVAAWRVRYDGSGVWSAQGYDRNGDAVWVPVTAVVRTGAGGSGSGGSHPIAIDAPFDLPTLIRNPLVIGAVAVAALLLVGRR